MGGGNSLPPGEQGENTDHHHPFDAGKPLLDTPMQGRAVADVVDEPGASGDAPGKSQAAVQAGKPEPDGEHPLLAAPFDGDAFAEAVAALYAQTFSLPPPLLPLMLRLAIGSLPQWYAPCASLAWWAGYWQVVHADDLLMGRRMHHGQPGKRASFKYLVSQDCIARMREVNQREVGRG